MGEAGGSPAVVRAVSNGACAVMKSGHEREPSKAR